MRISSTVQSRSALAAIAMSLAITGTAAAEDTTVNWVHIETNPGTLEAFNQIAESFEAANPGVDVRLQFIENEAFKSRLPTMLQSNDAPHIFFSWGGGVMAEQMRGGVLKDLSQDVDDEWRSWLSPGPLNAFQIDGAVYGVPVRTSLVGFLYNKDLFDQAGVVAEEIKTWDDFLAAVAKLKDAGITPITIGGAEGWPQHFFFSMLTMRIAGNETFNAALNGDGASFTDPEFVRAFEELQALAELEPFQTGWLGTPTQDTYAAFGNGDAAMIFQGDWAIAAQASNSTSGEGVKGLGWMPFPIVEGSDVPQTETFGGINGWLVFRDAPQEAVDFLRHFSQPENLTLTATRGNWVPPTPGIADALDDPWKRMVAEGIANSSYHQNFFNVMFAEETNRELLDIVTNTMTGDYTPEAAAEALQSSWEFSQ
ncbi:ABC transporter substrate-binding protein [Bauldia sp.]|uniref:ABC transporter substrate-binding protein n=1 Tax=Bauldia sp. TaxID=2575872 RepID=UPI003BAD8637